MIYQTMTPQGFEYPVNSSWLEYAPYCGEFCVEAIPPDVKQVYGVTIWAMQFIMPLVLITSCYACIFWKLSKGMTTGVTQKTNVACSERRKTQNTRRQRTNIMLVLMVVGFVCSSTPNSIYWLTMDFDLTPTMLAHQPYLSALVVHSLAMTSTVWNPILYAVLNQQLRDGAIEALPECVRRFFVKAGRDGGKHLTHKSTRMSMAMNGGDRSRQCSDFDGFDSAVLLRNGVRLSQDTTANGTACDKAMILALADTSTEELLKKAASHNALHSATVVTVSGDAADDQSRATVANGAIVIANCNDSTLL